MCSQVGARWILSPRRQRTFGGADRSRQNQLDPRKDHEVGFGVLVSAGGIVWGAGAGDGASGLLTLICCCRRSPSSLPYRSRCCRHCFCSFCRCRTAAAAAPDAPTLSSCSFIPGARHSCTCSPHLSKNISCSPACVCRPLSERQYRLAHEIAPLKVSMRFFKIYQRARHGWRMPHSCVGAAVGFDVT